MFVMQELWMQSRDYKEVGPRELAILNEGLRYSPLLCESIGTKWTGNPQITFWKVVYRRHTNFSMEAVEHTLNGNPDFGRQSTVTILRNGDLAGRTCLKVELNAVNVKLA